MAKTPYVLCMDAMNTLFDPIKGRFALYKDLLFKFAGIDNRSEAEIREVYQASRDARESGPAPSGKLPPGSYRGHWTIVNADMVKYFRPDISDAEARRIGGQIYDDVMGNPENYQINSEMVIFLNEAKRLGFELNLCTNQTPEGIISLLNHFGLRDYFNYVITSDEIGHKKPDPEFFKAAIKIIGKQVKYIIFFGNNPNNDMDGAASVGIPIRLLFDPRNEHANTKHKTTFHRVTSPMQIFDYINPH